MSFTVIVSGIRIREKASVGWGNVQFDNLQPPKKKGLRGAPWGIEKIESTAGILLSCGYHDGLSLPQERTPEKMVLAPDC